MAAAYQVGTASSPTDLLQKLVTWLVAQGWTLLMSQADGTGWRAHLSTNGIYINLRATPGNEVIWYNVYPAYRPTAVGIGLYVGTGFDPGLAWHLQPGGAIKYGSSDIAGAFMQTNVAAGIPKYHFFDDGSDNILVVAERSVGIHTNMGWGPSLLRAGSWVGGAYYFAPQQGLNSGAPWEAGTPGATDTSAQAPGTYADAQWSNSATFVRVDADSHTGKWIFNSSTTDGALGYTGKRGASALRGESSPPTAIPIYGLQFIARQVSLMNSQANLLPARLFVERDGGGYSLLGDLPNIYRSNGVGNGFAAGEIYSIGPDDYMAFPNFMVRKHA